MVTDLWLSRVYAILLKAQKTAKRDAKNTHYQLVVLAWLFPAFLSGFYFINGFANLSISHNIQLYCFTFLLSVIPCSKCGICFL